MLKNTQYLNKHIKLHMHDACIHRFMAWMSETALAVASQASEGKLFMRYNATCLEGPRAQDASHQRNDITCLGSGILN